jgi:hypothetical protein
MSVRRGSQYLTNEKPPEIPRADFKLCFSVKKCNMVLLTIVYVFRVNRSLQTSSPFIIFLIPLASIFGLNGLTILSVLEHSMAYPVSEAFFSR